MVGAVNPAGKPRTFGDEKTHALSREVIDMGSPRYMLYSAIVLVVVAVDRGKVT